MLTDTRAGIRRFGANVGSEGVHYRVWAPAHDSVHAIVGEGRRIALSRDDDGVFTGTDRDGAAGDLYWFELEGERLPDPASRYQPQGVEGPSQVVDPAAFAWSASWVRPPLRGRVIYELHVGTFTPAGTFRAAIERLDHLAELGVNALELMPLGDFAGRWNWGYDGVMLFAPARCYGAPDDLRSLIDAAHQRGLAVMVDVVYNHLGPCGNVLPRFSPDYFHPDRESPWGQSLNFDGARSGPVRAFFLQNAAAWFDEFRVDGLRLDAVHAIHDASGRHLVAEIAALADARGAFVIAEDERNEAAIITGREDGGWGVHGMWADDFHHTIRVALTGRSEAHLANFTGRTDEWVETLRHGWLYHGQIYPTWQRARGSNAGHLPPERFVYCISNHDQAGNRPLGDRLHEAVSPEAYRAASMLLCLVPYTPLLFMGQEWGASSRFPFFTDHPGEVGANMAANRRREFRHWNATYDDALLARMPDPQAEATFMNAKLEWEERLERPRASLLALYRDCLQLRAREVLFQSPPRDRWRVQKLGPRAIGIRWHDGDADWLLIVSLATVAQTFRPDPFIRPGEGRRWERALWSNAARYGGAADESDLQLAADGLRFTAPAAVLLTERAARAPGS